MAGEVFELTKRYFKKLTESEDGRVLLAKYNQTIGFEVVTESQAPELTKRYYFPRFSEKPLVGEERFVLEIKEGKLNFRQGEDVPVPAANWEEFDQNIKVLAERETFLALYNGKLRPVDALMPEAEQPTKLNILPFLPKWNYASWICRLIKLIARQNQPGNRF